MRWEFKLEPSWEQEAIIKQILVVCRQVLKFCFAQTQGILELSEVSCRATDYLTAATDYSSSQLLAKLGALPDSSNIDAPVSGCFKIPARQNLERAQTIC